MLGEYLRITKSIFIDWVVDNDNIPCACVSAIGGRMRIVRVFMIALGLLLGWASAFGQTSVNHNYNTGQVTYTLNSGPDTAYFNYYDVGGSAGN